MTGIQHRKSIAVALILAAIIAVGFVLRVYASVVAYYSTFDTATVGLMGIHILKGARPLFFYGQNYFGSMEAYFAALLFWLFGTSEFVLTMSPAIFSLGWIGATYLLFGELLGVGAGLAAALCVAVPGWVIVWYNIGSYGGYPVAFFLGTIALWIVLRITGRELSRLSYWLHVLALGFVAGLALWTHSITAAYLLTGAVILLAYLIRKHFAWNVILPFFAGGVLFVVGALPLLTSVLNSADDQTRELQFSGSVLARHARELFQRPLRAHIFYDIDVPVLLKVCMMTLVLVVIGIYAWRIKSAASRNERYRLLLPVLFAFAFLALYLPHPLASTKASRYTIPLWAVLVSGIFAGAVTVPATVLRRIAVGALVVWIGYFAVTDVCKARSKAEKKKAILTERREVVEKALKAGIKSAVLVCGPISGYEGQILSFYSLDRVKFVSAYHERCKESAQYAEEDQNGAFGCYSGDLAALKTALDGLGASYRAVEGSHLSLVHDVQVKPVRRRLIPSAQMRIMSEGPGGKSADNAADRIMETSCSGLPNGKDGITIDLGKERRINSMVLYDNDYMGDGLPRGYSVSVSTDGTNFSAIRNVDRMISPSYISGNRVFCKGYFGVLEIRFTTVPARYVRFVCLAGQRTGREWRISEVFVFEDGEDAGMPVTGSEVDNIVTILRGKGVDFAVADRWLSANLYKLVKGTAGRPFAYPRFCPRDRDSRITRLVVPRKGLAVAVAVEYAEECERLLKETYGMAEALDRVDCGHYSLFIFKAPPVKMDGKVRLYWNGHTLLKTTAPEAHFGVESEEGVDKGGA